MSRTKSAGRERLVRLLTFLTLAVLLAALSGRLSPHRVNDSPSYLEYPFDSLQQALLSIRTPGYPLFLALVSATLGLAWVPCVQVLIHAAASWALTEELLAWGMRLRAAAVAGACVLVGCTAADHIDTISTDALAASLGVASAAALMRTVRTAAGRDAILCAALATVTVAVRPAYLFLIPWIVLAGWLLQRGRPAAAAQPPRRRRRGRPGFRRPLWLSGTIAASVTAVVLGWMLLRKAVVDDFGIAPFGHQNLSAVLVQTLPPSQLRELVAPQAPLLEQLADQVADQLEAGDFELPAGSGQRIATLTLEDQWGPINYGVVWPTAKRLVRHAEADDPAVAEPVRVHRLIGRLNLAILKAAPDGYLRWLLLAVRRAVWGTAANLAMHPVFLAGLFLAAGWLLRRAASDRPPRTLVLPDAWHVLALVGLSYAALGVAVVILTSPPIGRFADAAAIFLPGLLFSALLGAPPLPQASNVSASAAHPNAGGGTRGDVVASAPTAITPTRRSPGKIP